MEEKFKPLQKVIRFDRAKPEIAYVIKPVFYGHVVIYDGRTRIRVSNYEKEATLGKGTAVRIERLHPFSDELWAACEQWMQDGGDLKKTFSKLAKGKIAYTFQPRLIG